MKRTLLLMTTLALLTCLQAFSQVLYQESFETDGSGGTRYTLSEPHANDGGGEDYFERSDSTGFKTLGMDMFPEGEEGTYFLGFEDLNGGDILANTYATITLNSVDVSSASSLKIKMLIAGNPVTNKFDDRSYSWGDFIDVEVNIDEGGWDTIASFCSPAGASNSGYMYWDEDRNGSGGDNGEIIYLTGDFREFIFDVEGTGTNLVVRITVQVESGDEEVAIDNIRIYNDNEAPVFNVGYPKADDIQTEQFDVVMNINEPGNVYYLLKDNGAPAPTPADVLLVGNSMEILYGDIDYSATISGLTPDTEYDLYFVAADDEVAPNVQSSVTLLEVKTLEPKEVNLTFPVGGEDFYLGDTIDLTWTHNSIDSIDIYYWLDVFGLGEMFISIDGQARADADPGTSKFILNPILSADSSRIMIADYENSDIADTSGWFYITDTTFPGIFELYPANKTADVLRDDSLAITFNEFMEIDTGSIKIYNEDGSLYDSIPVPSSQVMSFLDVAFIIQPNKLLVNDSSYYVLIDSATFTDRGGNAFRGITADTTWTFTVADNRDLVITYPEGGENFYVGDTVIIRWTSENLDSIQLWAWGFEEETWYPVLESDTRIYAEQDTFVLPVPLDAGLDSTYFRLTWADDFSFFTECGTFYLTDTIKPFLEETMPAKGDSNIATNPELIFELNEQIFKGTGNVTIRKKADGSVHEIIPVSSEQVEVRWEEAEIWLTKPLEKGITYYVMIDSGAFLDFQDNAFNGILDDTTWYFTTIGKDLMITEYIEGGSSRKALELYNPTDKIIQLDEYRIAQSANGAGWAYWHYFPGGSTLAPGEFYIMITSDNTFTDSTYFDPADADEILSPGGSAVSFNGNDARAIEKDMDGEWGIIDIFGDPDSDQNYDVAGIAGAAKDHTIRRKDFILMGNEDWPSSAGTNAFDSEWKVLEKDNFENLGFLTPPSDTLAEIDSFYLAEQTMLAVIDSAAATIDVEVALGTKLDSLFPYIEVSPNADVEPASGDSVDFSGGTVEFTVTAEDRQHVKVWTVNVTVKTIPSSENDIVTFVLAKQTGAAVIDAVNHIVTAEVEYGTSLTALVPTITVSASATIDPASGVAQDFTDTVDYTVTAQDASVQVWEVVVTVEKPVEVATVAELKAATIDNTTLYKLTGEVVLTHQIPYRSKKYVQDATGGFEIDDDPGKITTTYNIGDGITGLVGTLEDYNGLIQLHPVEDPGAATTTGNTITPVEITAAELNANYNDYEAEIITLRGVTFSDAGADFTGGYNYDLVQGTETTVFRAHFYDADYIGTAIPDGLHIVTGVILEYNGTAQIASRNAADIVPLVLSSEKDILTFVLAEQTGDADINATGKTVDIEVASGTDVTALTPTITISDLATIDPASGVSQDFTSPVTYTVTAEDETTADWTVTVTVETGIDPVLVNNLFEAYPNPSQGVFTLKLATETGTEFEVTITSLSGQVMMDRTIDVFGQHTESLDLTHFGAGIYLMKVRTSDQIQIKKLVIE